MCKLFVWSTEQKITIQNPVQEFLYKIFVRWPEQKYDKKDICVGQLNQNCFAMENSIRSKRHVTSNENSKIDILYF
jgi:hypothetical protein